MRVAGRRVRRADVARLAAPVAFFGAVTIAALLVHSALQSGGAAPKKRAVAQRPAPVLTIRRSPEPAAARTVEHAAPRAKPKPKPKAVYYVVESGDTFGTISTRFGTTVAALEQLNPGVESNALAIGQKLRVK